VATGRDSGGGGYVFAPGIGIGFACRDLGRAIGESVGFSRSAEDRGVSGAKEKGDTGPSTGLRLPLLCGNVSALSRSTLGNWIGDALGEGSGEEYFLLAGLNSPDDLLDLDPRYRSSSSA
jgi:hypothetical protein